MSTILFAERFDDKIHLLDHLRVAGRRFGVVGGRGQSAGGVEPGSFHFHSFHFTFFRLGKLGGYDYQTQIDHKKRSDLQHKKKKKYIYTHTNENDLRHLQSDS